MSRTMFTPTSLAVFRRSQRRGSLSLSLPLSPTPHFRNLAAHPSVFRMHDTSGAFAGNLWTTCRVRSWIRTSAGNTVGLVYIPREKRRDVSRCAPCEDNIFPRLSLTRTRSRRFCTDFALHSQRVRNIKYRLALIVRVIRERDRLRRMRILVILQLCLKISFPETNIFANANLYSSSAASDVRSIYKTVKV